MVRIIFGVDYLLQDNFCMQELSNQSNERFPGDTKDVQLGVFFIGRDGKVR